MKVKSVKIISSANPVEVIDCLIESGFIQGDGGSLPDVDIDYQSDRRQEVKEYLERRYNHDGKQRVFSAGTYSTLKIKAVLKDIARVNKIPVNLVNYMTAMLEDSMSWTDLFLFASQSKPSTKKLAAFINKYPKVFEDMRPIMMQPRSASIHASALIVTPDFKDGVDMECFDFTPIKKVDGMLVSEFDGNTIDSVGLLKNDILGTKELAKIQTTLALCNRYYDANLTFKDLVTGDLNDHKAYKMLANGYTQNIFQLSSKGMTKFLVDMQPTNIHDIIAANALYRPATIESGSTEKYVDSKNGILAPVYLWGTYNALKDTFALLTYQEQLSQIAQDVGGFSLGEGIKLMKLVSKKKPEEIHKMKVKFIEGSAQKGCPKEDSEKIWEMIESGGSYLFNKSHATAYALTAYVGAYLKANYPSAFYTVALQWAKDDEIPTIMSEMEQCSIAKIVHPDINISGSEFYTDYEKDKIFWSLTRIKQVGLKAVNWIIQEREKNGQFTSLENFIHRVFKYKLKKYEYWDDPDDEDEAVKCPVNARHIRNMICAGCFDNIERVQAVVERWRLIQIASKELGFDPKEEDFPLDKIDKHYFWSMLQVDLSGVGAIDYRRIYDNSDVKNQLRGRFSYTSLRDCLRDDSDGKKVAICANVLDVIETGYNDKKTGERKTFVKIQLQQNNDMIELVAWDDFYNGHKQVISEMKNRIVILSAMVRYSDYTGSNGLQTFKSTTITLI